MPINLTETNKKIKAYTLEDISKWQNEGALAESQIQLPSLQRGFVWKCHQIEALWDSILRGYPLGSLLMSVDTEKATRFLLDGQQRCTSIALGFYNPFELRKGQYFSLKDYLPSIWIDLKPDKDKISSTQKYVLRLLTKSHPWGYQIQRDNNGNARTLSMTDRRAAFTYFQTKQPDISYMELQPSKINPWDACYPVPLSSVLDADFSSLEVFVAEIRNVVSTLQIQTKYSLGQNVDYSDVQSSEIEKIYNGILIAKKTLIPEIVVDINLLKEDDGEEPDQLESQDPTLFVRLNSAGTRLSGEELMYSVYKAAFPEAKNLVESIGANYIAPSKVINLIARLTQCVMDNFSTFPKDFNITTFRKALKSDRFRKNMQAYIGNGERSDAQTLLESVKQILSQNKINIPALVIKQFMVSMPELLLVLVLYIKRYGFSKTEIKDISSSYICFLWFSVDNKKLPSFLFKHLFENGKCEWRTALDQLIREKQVLPVFNPDALREDLKKIVVQRNINFDQYSIILEENLLCDETISVIFDRHERSDERIKETWGNFINRIFWNKTLLLLAQNHYVIEKFKDFNQFESIEDTNRPWDWDHIYPISWVYYQGSIHPLVKHWVNSIGNFRALSYDDNRSESNYCSPAYRLKDDQQKEDSFILDNDLEFWKKLDDSSKKITHEQDPLNFLSAITTRMINVYEKWYYDYYQ